MGNFVFPFLAMLLTVKLGYSREAAGVFMSVISLLSGLSLLLGGKLGDTFGRKRTVATIQSLAAILFLVCAALGLRPIVPFIVAAASILLQGTWPVFNAIVADLTPPESRKRAYALLYWGNNIGFSIGPIMAGYLFNTHTAWMFYGNATALMIVSMLMAGLVPETKPETPKLQPAAGAGAAAASIPAAEAAETGSVFAILARRPTLLTFAFINLLLHFVYQQHMFALPLFLTELMGDAGPRLYGNVMTANGLTVVILTAVLTMIFSRLSATRNIALAAVFYAVGFGMLFFCSAPIAVIVSTVIWTIGEILSATNSSVFIAAHAPISHRGRVNSAVSFISGAGTTLAPLLAGWYIGFWGTRAVWLPIGVLALLGSALLLALERHDRRSGQPLA